MLKLKPTSYIYLSQICPAERQQQQQNAVWNCDDPGEELSATHADKLTAPAQLQTVHRPGDFKDFYTGLFLIHALPSADTDW